MKSLPQHFMNCSSGAGQARGPFFGQFPLEIFSEA
jgi:hypothetical protein